MVVEIVVDVELVVELVVGVEVVVDEVDPLLTVVVVPCVFVDSPVVVRALVVVIVSLVVVGWVVVEEVNE